VETVWKRYHARIAAELARIRAEHGAALLWDAHSIVSECPRLFAGRLPDFNFGTGGGASCDPRIAETLLQIVNKNGEFTAALDARFKGGYITRHHGRPDENVHAIQLELSQRVYMDETPPYTFRPERARRVQRLLRSLVELALERLPRQPAPARSR
jgi:N-formylglutamate deformylase